MTTATVAPLKANVVSRLFPNDKAQSAKTIVRGYHIATRGYRFEQVGTGTVFVGYQKARDEEQYAEKMQTAKDLMEAKGWAVTAGTDSWNRKVWVVRKAI